jgi:ESF2/ABP1 family protein
LFTFKVEDEQNEEDEEMDENSDNSDDIMIPTTSKEQKIKKKVGKKGIIYISSIPKHMNVAICRELLESYGEINRIFLQPDKKGYKSKIIRKTKFCPFSLKL